MKKLQFTTFILLLLAGFTAEAQRYSTMSTKEIQKRLAAHAPIKKGDELKSRSPILLDSTVCNMKMPFGEDPLEATYFEYNEANQLVKDSTFYWDIDSISGELVKYPGVKQYYTYTPTGEIHTITTLGWGRDKNEWGKDSLRLEYIYEGGRLSSINNDFYYSEFNQWFTDAIEYYYYEGDVLMGILVGSYDSENMFSPIARVDFTYFEGLLVKEEYYFTFDGGELWTELFYTEIVYHFSRPTSTFTYFYDEELEEYTPLEATQSVYNMNDLLDVVLTYIWLGDWETFRSCTYYYTEDQVSAIDEKVRPLIDLVMSNPFQGGIVTAPGLEDHHSYTVEIIDVTGRIIHSFFGLGNTWVIDAPGRPGIYLVRVRHKNHLVAHRKIVTGPNY